MKLKYLILFAFAFSVLAISLYFLWMCWPGSNYCHLSSDSQDWGGFGAYIGGVVGTLSGIVAAFFLYSDLKQSTENERRNVKIKEMELTKDSLQLLADKLDEFELHRAVGIDMMRGTFKEKSVKELIIFLGSDENGKAWLNQVKGKEKERLHTIIFNIGTILRSVRIYIKSLKSADLDFPTHHLVASQYWQYRYLELFNCMNVILGKGEIEQLFVDNPHRDKGCLDALFYFKLLERSNDDKGHDKKSD